MTASAIFFVLCLLYGTVDACTSEMDCTACHECIRGVCVPVEEGTDPIGECPMLCDVKLVCSRKQVCVYQVAPTCNCNWISGLCMTELPSSSSIITATTTATDVVLQNTVALEQLQLLGYSDSDIRMFIELFRSEMDFHHQPSPPPLLLLEKEKEEEERKELREHAELMRILGIVQEIVPSITLLFLVCGIFYFRRNMTVPSVPIKKTA